MAELSVAWTRKDGNFVLADLDAQYTTFIQKIYGLGLKMKMAGFSAAWTRKDENFVLVHLDDLNAQ